MMHEVLRIKTRCEKKIDNCIRQSLPFLALHGRHDGCYLPWHVEADASPPAVVVLTVGNTLYPTCGGTLYTLIKH